MKINAHLISPRIAALKQALAAGEENALDDFWKDLAVKGAPIIEKSPEPGKMLVTFVWQGDEQTHNVLLTGSLTFIDADIIKYNKLQNLAGTGVWFLTKQIRSDLRTTYQFSPNDPLTPLFTAEDLEKRIKNFQADPLNKESFFSPADPEGFAGPAKNESVLSLPDAPLQSWSQLRPNVPAGKVEEFRLRSEILNNERRVWVYTPSEAYVTSQTETPYLLLIFDGWGVINWMKLPVILDNLLAEGLIPPVVAVLPDALDMNTTRGLELPCYPPFAAFLKEELLPWAQSRYHFEQNPDRRVVAGASYGGLAAAYIGLNHPELFANVLSLSGAYWWHPEQEAEDEWLTRQYAAAERKPLSFYLSAGLLERVQSPGVHATILSSNRHLRTVLQAKGYPVHYAEFNGGHDPVCWRGSLADGLLALIGKK